MAELKFEIKEHIGTVSKSSKGWTKELNIVRGTVQTLNLICVIGHRNMKKWVKVLLLQTKN